MSERKEIWVPFCKYGVLCNKKDVCPNFHPFEISNKRTISFSHPRCYYGILCKRKGCYYEHPVGWNGVYKCKN
jgi:hypothetical protein